MVVSRIIGSIILVAVWLVPQAASAEISCENNPGRTTDLWPAALEVPINAPIGRAFAVSQHTLTIKCKNTGNSAETVKPAVRLSGMMAQSIVQVNGQNYVKSVMGRGGVGMAVHEVSTGRNVVPPVYDGRNVLIDGVEYQLAGGEEKIFSLPLRVSLAKTGEIWRYPEFRV